MRFDKIVSKKIVLHIFSLVSFFFFVFAVFPFKKDVDANSGCFEFSRTGNPAGANPYTCKRKFKYEFVLCTYELHFGQNTVVL